MLTMLAAALITGLALMPSYRATGTQAYTSVTAITHSGFLGLLRSMHHWASALLIVFGEVYVISGLFRGAYRKPGQWLWIGSIVLLLIGLAMQITGHLLPFDQQAVRTAVVETGIAANAPVVGTMQGNLMRGGADVGPNTLHLWYLAHITAFTILGFALIFGLPAIARKLGTSIDRKAWIVGSFLLLLIFCVKQPPLGSPASSSDFTDSSALPEWYILPLHSLLVIAQALNPNAAYVGTMLVPGIALLLLLALPWIHQKESIAVARTLGVVGGAVLIGLFGYSFASVAPPVGNQVVQQAPSTNAKPIKLDATLVARGKKLFDNEGCSDCHMVNGSGGKIGPDLSNEAAKNRGLDWQEQHILSPGAVMKGSTMTPFKGKVSDAELKALAEYVSSLGTKG